jgi:hypothetical protein
MRAAETFQTKTEAVADLPPTLVYKLAAPSTPRSIREKVVADLEAGRRINCVAVTKEIDQSRPRHLLDKARQAEKAAEEANAILEQLSVTDQERLLSLLGKPGVWDQLDHVRRR